MQRSGIDTSSTTPDPGYQWESDKLIADTTNESQEVSHFPAGDHKAHINIFGEREFSEIQSTQQGSIRLFARKDKPILTVDFDLHRESKYL